MSTDIKYTCDRCGNTAMMSSEDFKNWGRVGVVLDSAPNGSVAFQSKDLCSGEDCYPKFKSLMTPVTKTS